ncbi:Methyltransferase FkbM [Trinorchestia longiramus]|nr:Methyltransferase FkbM [Trinorchestia longiramus]
MVFCFAIYFAYLSKVLNDNIDMEHTSVGEQQQLLWRMEGPLSSTDKRLLTLVRKNYLVPPPPSSHHHKPGRKLRAQELGKSFVTRIFLYSVIKDLFSDEKPGFFVEAGALDGLLLSNSLFLETSLNWTGLLIEPDPRNYKILAKKRRKAWLTPVCLSRHSYPETGVLQQASRLAHSQPYDGNSRILNDLRTPRNPYSAYLSVQCLPVATLLTALNVTHVHFFSLDTEGGELDMIKNFPFNDITVDVWSIEHVSPKWNAGGSRVPLRFESLQSLRHNASVPAREIAELEQVLKYVEDEDLIDFMLRQGVRNLAETRLTERLPPSLVLQNFGQQDPESKVPLDQVSPQVSKLLTFPLDSYSHTLWQTLLFLSSFVGIVTTTIQDLPLVEEEVCASHLKKKLATGWNCSSLERWCLVLIRVLLLAASTAHLRAVITTALRSDWISSLAIEATS